MKRLWLNRNQLKYLVIVAMLIDHIAWGFVPLESVAGQVMHFIGRLTGPTMGYFLAEGYIHTRNKAKYGLRLGIFALISWVPFSLFEVSYWPSMHQSVIYTLFLGFLAMWVWDREKLSQTVKWLIIIGLIVLSLPGDWAIFDVAWPLALYIYRDNEQDRLRRYTVLCVTATLVFVIGGDPWWRGLCNLGIMMVPLILRFCYNGERGSNHPFHKWFFYVFYPLHLLVLFLIKQYIL